MSRLAEILLLLAAVTAIALALSSCSSPPAPQPEPAPAPIIPPAPPPAPAPEPDPKPKRPLLRPRVDGVVADDDTEGLLRRRPRPVPQPAPGPVPPGPPAPGPNRSGKITIGGPVGPDGKTEVVCDLPVDQRIKNIGSKVDGAGMCVASSVEMALRWQGLDQMRGFRDWCAKQPGGSYPTKTDRQIKEFCRAKGIEVPNYMQFEGSDPALIEAAMKSGRFVACTYGGSDGVRYRGRISHMTNCVCYGPLVAILDCNAIGENELLWMPTAEFLARWKSGGSGWLFVWLAPGPSPPPTN